MHSKLILWLVTAMLRWTLPEAQHEDARARYESIARDAAEVAFDSDEAPLFPGPLGRTKTAALILSIASYESAFEEDVDVGTKRGDHGRSWCLAQINLGTARVRVEDQGQRWAYSFDGVGWSGRDLVRDRKKCFRTALHMARTSLRSCGNLSVYTSGRCSKTEPQAIARYRRATARFGDLGQSFWLDSDIAVPGPLASNP
jgi:hypothetical protein